MKAIALPALFSGLLSSAVLASPVNLTNDQMDHIAAGSTVMMSLANLGTLRVVLDGNTLHIDGDSALLNAAAVKIGGQIVRLQGRPLDLALPDSASFTVLAKSPPDASGTAAFRAAVKFSDGGQTVSTHAIGAASISVQGTANVVSQSSSSVMSSVHSTVSSTVTTSR